MQDLLQQMPSWAFLVAAAAIVFYPQAANFVRGIISGGGVKAISMADHINAIATHVAVNCQPESRDKCLVAIDSLRAELTTKPIKTSP